jgi:hypothetical protein
VGIGLQPAQEAPGRPGTQSLSPIRDIVLLEIDSIRDLVC